jgi:hypothetical protein
MRSSGTRRSDQSAVWNEIAARASKMEADSLTRAMAAVYEKHATALEEHVRAFECARLQSGMAFGIDGRAVGLDLFDHPVTFSRLFPKLLRSYALDALEATKISTPAVTAQSSIDDVLRHIAAAPSFAEPAVGLGKDVRFSGEVFSGAALWADNRFIHVCAFSTADPDPAATLRTRISRPTRRSRH